MLKRDANVRIGPLVIAARFGAGAVQVPCAQTSSVRRGMLGKSEGGAAAPGRSQAAIVITYIPVEIVAAHRTFWERRKWPDLGAGLARNNLPVSVVEPSVPVLTFVSCCSERFYECQNQRDTNKSKILVRFWI